MKEYICKEEAVNLIKSFDDSSLDDYYRAGLFEAETGIADMPAADVVEVAHGKWKEKNYFNEHYGRSYECSNCGEETIGIPNYCPKCGAKMDKED